MRAFTATYSLRNGTRQSLTLIDTCTVGAVIQVIDLFGDQLSYVSARAH